MSYTVLGQGNTKLGKVRKATPRALKRFFEQISSGYDGELHNQFLEILDCNGNKTGALKLRDLVHREGDWHGAFHFHIYSIPDGKPYIIFQKRRHDKDVGPGKLDTVAAGHFEIGEGVVDGLREVREEIGLDVYIGDMFYVGKRKNYEPQPSNGILNLEFQSVALHRCDQPLQDYTLQEEELAGIVRVGLEEFIDLMMLRRNTIPNNEAVVFNDGLPEETTLRIKRGDIIAAPFDNYYLKTALLIQRVVEGKQIPYNPFRFDVTEFM